MIERYAEALTEIFDKFESKNVVEEQFIEVVRKKNSEIEKLDKIKRRKQKIIMEATKQIDKEIKLQEALIVESSKQKRHISKILDSKFKVYDSTVKKYKRRFPKLVVNGYKKNPLA